MLTALLLAATTFLPTDLPLNRSYAGSYELAPGHIVDIGPFYEVGGDLVFLDEKTLREGRLRPISRTTYTAGPTLGSDEPIDVRVEFTSEGLRWTGEGLTDVAAKKIAPSRIEMVEVKNGDVTLRGSLTVPLTAGKHPAIIFAPGAGKTQRDDGPWNVFFARLGFAVLSLDKRGVGESTGDFRKATMDDLASDLAAGFDYLAARSDIDAKRIGVHGTSQGGWTAPLLAKKRKNLAFLIARAGSGTTVVDTMAHEVMWGLREQGVAENDAKRAEGIAQKAFAIMARGGTWEEFRKVVQPAQSESWAKSFWLLEVQNEQDPDWSWLRGNGQYDSSETLKSVRLPILWFLGEYDHNVPSAVSETKLRAAFKKARNRDTAIVWIKSGHSFLRTSSGNNSEFPQLSHAAEGYWSTMEDWLRRHGFAQ